MNEGSLENAKIFLHKLVEAANFNEKINVEFFKKIFTKELNRSLTDIHINYIFKDGIDNNGNGVINFDEFITVFSFVMSDKNGDGQLDRSELKLLVKNIFQHEILEKEALNGIQEIDDDGDGKICYREWREFLLLHYFED